MSEIEIDSAATVPASKSKKAGEKKTAAKPAHPPTSDMVNNAIKGLKERSGSSLQAIKKYIASNYKVDSEKLAPFIRKYLKSAVQTGSLIQTKGKGASGSFKLAAGGTANQSKPKTLKPKKTAAVSGEKKKKKSAVGKSSTTIKTTPKLAVTSTTKAKKSAATVDKKIKTSKLPSKVKKTAKSPTKKPKAPKPKTVKTVASTAKPKKPVSPKKKK